jgi:hypothetical protein
MKNNIIRSLYLCRILFSYCYSFYLYISKKFSLEGGEGYEIPMDRKM